MSKFECPNLKCASNRRSKNGGKCIAGIEQYKICTDKHSANDRFFHED